MNERTQQLVASQERYKGAVRSGGGLCLHGGEDGIIVAVNKREEQALGYSSNRWWGAAFWMASRCTMMTCRGLLAKIHSGERQVPTQEITVCDAAGKETPVEMDLILVRGSDHTWMMVQLRDITDRKRLERQKCIPIQQELEAKGQRAYEGNRRNEAVPRKPARKRQ